MKGQVQNVSESWRHQQCCLMRLSQLDYPQGNKDGGQRFLLAADIYGTRWVLKGFSNGRQCVAPSNVVEDWLMCSSFLEIPSPQTHQAHTVINHFKCKELNFWISTTQCRNMHWWGIWPFPAVVLRCPHPLRIKNDQSYAHSTLTFPPP